MGADVSIAEGWYGTGSSILSNMANFSLEGEVGLHSLSANPMNILSSYPCSDGDIVGEHFRLHFWRAFSTAFLGCQTYGAPVLACIAALLIGCVTVVVGKILAARLSADGSLEGKDRIRVDVDGLTDRNNMTNFSLEGEVGLHSLSANPMNIVFVSLLGWRYLWRAFSTALLESIFDCIFGMSANQLCLWDSKASGSRDVVVDMEEFQSVPIWLKKRRRQQFRNWALRKFLIAISIATWHKYLLMGL